MLIEYPDQHPKQHPHDAPRSPARVVAGRSLMIACSALVPLLLCATAQAQAVRKCQVDGRTVFQSSPCAPEQQAAAATPQAVAPEAAGAASAPKKKTLADVMRERDAGDRPQPRSRETQADGANVLRSRMGAI